MSFNPAGIPTVNYIGAPAAQPSAVGTRPKQIPRVVPLTFNWQLYGVSNSNSAIQVPINLAQNAQTRQLDAIRGVYIDNTGCDAAVYVYFPDTGCIVTCAQFSTNWQPVFTNLLQCVVIGKGFVTGDTSQTTIFLSNETFPPGESAELQFVYPQYLASPRITRGVNQFTPGFTSPAIGDQWQFLKQSLAAIGTFTTTLFGSPYVAGGFITLTNLTVSIGNSAGSSTAVATGTFTIQSTGISGALFNGDLSPQGLIIDQSALQLKLNANETWQFSAVVGTGASNDLSLFLGYSYAGVGTAETLFNFGNLNLTLSAQNYIVGGTHLFAGVQFTAPETGSILSALVQLVPQVGSGGASFSVALYSDNAGNPGTLLATSVPTLIPGFANAQPVQFNFPQPLPQIINGTKYWLVFPSVNPAPNKYNLPVTSLGAVNVNFSGGSNTTIAAIGNGTSAFPAGSNISFQINCQQP